MPQPAEMANFLLYVLFVATLLAAAYVDLRRGKIPNALTLPAMAAFLVLRGLAGGLPGLSDAGLGLVAGLTVFLAPYALGLFGAGDVKLLAAAGAALGVQAILTLFLFTSVSGGLLYVVYGLLKIRDPGGLGRGLPKYRYGPAIALGAIGALAYHLAGNDYIAFTFLR